MKRLKHLVFLILLMFPLFVSAKNIIMTLDYQTNTNAYTDGTIGDIFVYSMNDYYFIYYDNYNAGAVDVKNYLAVDKKGQVKYSELDIWEEVLYAGDRVFLLTWDRRYVSSNNYENKILITEINPKTNDIINTLTIDDTYTTNYNYFNSFYYNEHGLVIETSYSGIFLVNIEDKTHEKVDETYLYNKFESPYEQKKVSTEEYEKFMKRIQESEEIKYNTSHIDYAVEYEDNYFTLIVSKEGELLLVYTDKNNETEVRSIKVNNEELANYGIGNAALVSEEDGINVFLVAGGKPCLRGIEIPSECFANGDIIMQHYKLKYNIITKTNGNGTITAKQTVADSGEEVTFTVEPKEGYVLSEVRVTDANGNVVVFTDYTFTMPSADVTIEATFIKEVDNSETSDSTIMMFIATMSILIFIAANYKRKVLE